MCEMPFEVKLLPPQQLPNCVGHERFKQSCLLASAALSLVKGAQHTPKATPRPDNTSEPERQQQRPGDVRWVLGRISWLRSGFQCTSDLMLPELGAGGSFGSRGRRPKASDGQATACP